MEHLIISQVVSVVVLSFVVSVVVLSVSSSTKQQNISTYYGAYVCYTMSLAWISVKPVTNQPYRTSPVKAKWLIHNEIHPAHLLVSTR